MTAGSIDALFISVLLVGISNLLPHRPPVDAMAFFSSQDFVNYFVLVACGAFLSYAYVVLGLQKGIGATLGTFLTRLRLVSFDGESPVKAAAVHARGKRAALIALAILVPGPIVALFVAFLGSALLGRALMSANEALVALGLDDRVIWLIHSLSFMLLAIAIVWVIVPRKEFNRRGKLTELDRRTKTVFVKKGLLSAV